MKMKYPLYKGVLLSRFKAKTRAKNRQVHAWIPRVDLRGFHAFRLMRQRVDTAPLPLSLGPFCAPLSLFFPLAALSLDERANKKRSDVCGGVVRAVAAQVVAAGVDDAVLGVVRRDERVPAGVRRRHAGAVFFPAARRRLAADLTLSATGA